MPKKLSLVKAVLVALVTAGLVMAVGIWWTRRSMNVDVAASASTKPSAKPVVSASGSINILGPGSAKPSASTATSAAPSASAVASEQEGDGSELPATLGYLEVNFNGEQGGEVYVHGKLYGPVGKKLRVPCKRPGFVRIGKLPGPRWLSKGKPVSIKCQATTTTSFTP